MRSHQKSTTKFLFPKQSHKQNVLIFHIFFLDFMTKNQNFTFYFPLAITKISCTNYIILMLLKFISYVIYYHPHFPAWSKHVIKSMKPLIRSFSFAIFLCICWQRKQNGNATIIYYQQHFPASPTPFRIFSQKLANNLIFQK